MKDHAFGFHLLKAAVDQFFLHFEIGDAIAQQASGFGLSVIKMHIVSGAGQLLGSGHAGGSGTNNRDFFASQLNRRLRVYPALGKALVDDGTFNGFDGYRVIINVQGAGSLAWGGADAAGKLGEVVG